MSSKPLIHVKLGKAHPRFDRRTLRLASYLDAEALPAPPDSVSWSGGVKDWGMMLNDLLGDCTCAGAGHLIQCWTNVAGSEIVIPDTEIEAAYQAVGGYKPGDESTDNGAVELDVLNYWRQTGIGGRKIEAFAALDFRKEIQVRQAIQLFGGIYIGLALPASAQSQEVWDYVPDAVNGSNQPGSWGGHAVCVLEYSPTGLTCITWGEPKLLTWKFWETYCDESYAVVSKDFIGDDLISPAGLNLDQLLADLMRITH